MADRAADDFDAIRKRMKETSAKHQDVVPDVFGLPGHQFAEYADGFVIFTRVVRYRNPARAYKGTNEVQYTLPSDQDIASQPQ